MTKLKSCHMKFQTFVLFQWLCSVCTCTHLKFVEVVVDLNGVTMDVLHDLVDVWHTNNFVTLNNEYVYCHVFLAWNCIILNLYFRKKILIIKMIFHFVGLVKMKSENKIHLNLYIGLFQDF